MFHNKGKREREIWREMISNITNEGGLTMGNEYDAEEV